jgi:hypothetical protein
MFYEYAIDPRAVGSSWATFRYIIEKFGFDQGRLISISEALVPRSHRLFHSRRLAGWPPN